MEPFIGENLFRSFESQIDTRRKLLGISDRKITEKVIYAFFLDRFHPKNEDEAIVYQNLTGLEWCSGFLASRSLENLIIRFLASTYSNQLSFDVINKLNSFVDMLHKAREHYAEIDLALSSDIALDLFAATNNPLFIKFAYPRKLETADFQKIVDHCVERVKALGVGEIALFQSGRRIHVAPLTITRLEDGSYEVHKYDTTSDASLVCFNLNEVHEFFTNEIKCKLEDKISLNKFKSPISLKKAQMKNTCHTKGLLTLLYKNINNESREMRKGALDLSWNDFKCLFGQFIMDQEIDKESALYQLSLLEQETREEKRELRKLMKTVIESGDEAVQQVGSEYDREIREYIPELSHWIREPIKTDSLMVHHRKLSKLLAHVSSKKIEQVSLSKSLSPVVRKSLDIIIDKKKHQEMQAIPQIQKQITELEYENTLLGKIAKEINQYAEVVRKKFFKLGFNAIAEDPPPADIPIEELKYYLALLLENIKELNNVTSKPALIDLLMQSIEEGCFNEFFAVYENLQDEDQDRLKKYIQHTVSGNLKGTIVNDVAFIEKIKYFDLYGNMFNPIIINTLIHLIESNNITDFKNLFSLLSPNFFTYRNPANILSAYHRTAEYSGSDPTSLANKIMVLDLKNCQFGIEEMVNFYDTLKDSLEQQQILGLLICNIALSKEWFSLLSGLMIQEQTGSKMIMCLLNVVSRKKIDVSLVDKIIYFLLEESLVRGKEMLILLLEITSKKIAPELDKKILSYCARNIDLIDDPFAIISLLQFSMKKNLLMEFIDVFDKISVGTKSNLPSKLWHTRRVINDIAAADPEAMKLLSGFISDYAAYIVTKGCYTISEAFDLPIVFFNICGKDFVEKAVAIMKGNPYEQDEIIDYLQELVSSDRYQHRLSVEIITTICINLLKAKPFNQLRIENFIEKNSGTGKIACDLLRNAFSKEF